MEDNQIGGDQIIAKQFKVDKKLQLSNSEFGIREIIEKAIQPVKTKEQKLRALKRKVSVPNNYVFASLASRIYTDRKDGTDKNGENLHGQVVDSNLGKWQLLTVVHRFKNGYIGTAYWNPDMQQVIIVHSGTQNIGGFFTDIRGIFLNIHSSQINSAITFTDIIVDILKKIGKSDQDEENRGPFIQLFITGHSLGAWLTPITSFSAKYVVRNGDGFLASKNFEKTGYHASAVIFDPPGCKNMLQIIQDKLMERSSPSLISSLDITTFVTTPNLINACNPYVGDAFKLFIFISEEEKQSWKNMNINYTRFTHQIKKIKEVFDSESGEVLKDDNGKLRIKKVLDWPLLISGNEEAAYVDKIVWCMKQAASFLLPPPLLAMGQAAYSAYSCGKWYWEFYQELRAFFKLANKSNNFHLNEDEVCFDVGGNRHRTIRYKTEFLNENYKNERNTNVFTQAEHHFLDRYKILMKYQSLPGVLNPQKLFASLADQQSIDEVTKMLKDYEIKEETLYSSKLSEFIPHIKCLLHLFPGVTSKVDEAYRALPIGIRNGIYQSATSSYLDTIEDGLGLVKDILELDSFLKSSDTKILHTIQSSTIVGVAIINDLFKSSNYGYSEKEYHAFLNLYRILCLGWSLLIGFINDINHKYLLVLVCDDVLDGKMKEFFKELFNVIGRNSFVKTILVTERSSNVNDFFTECALRFSIFDKAYQVKENIEVKLADFTPESQSKLLEKKVIFQGREVPLNKILARNARNLDAVIDPETIVALLKNESIQIGKTLPSLGQTEDYYIDRTLIRNVTINKDAFKEESLSDLFVISNVTKSELSKLVNPENVRSFKLEEDNDISNPIQFIALDGENDEVDFKSLCSNYSRHRLHWLRKEGNNFIWQSSYGMLTGLRKCVDITSANTLSLDNVNDLHGRFVIITAEPGMGKTTTLTYLGSQKMDFEWLIRINLVEHKDILGSDINCSDISEVLDLLHATDNHTLSSKLTKALIKLHLNSKDIVLLLDGFDEISPCGRQNIKKLLVLLKTYDMKKVIISTRFHFRHELEDTLSTIAYTFQPFSQEEQKRFLKNFWLKSLNADTRQDCLDAYIDKLLKFISQSIHDKDRKFMGIPLQMKMIAEAFRDGLEDSMILSQYDNDELIFPTEFDIFKLYDRFIHAKYRVFFGKIGACINLEDEVHKNWFTTRLRQIHGSVAFNVMFPEMNGDFLKASLPSEAEKDAMKLVGIIQFVNNEIMFTHRTFSEYFVADFVAYNVNSEEISEAYKIMLKFLATQLFRKENEVIKIFLDYHFAKEKIHIAAFKGKLDDVLTTLPAHTTDILGRSALHYAAQGEHGDIVDALLNNGANASAADKLGKTPLHYAARYNFGKRVISHLLEKSGRCINSKDNIGCTPLYYAAEQGNWNIVECLIEKGADTKALNQNALIFYYAHNNNHKLVKTLIDQGADINTKDNHDNTLLHIAVQRECETIVNFLLQEKVDVNVFNACDKTPMSYGAEKKHWSIVESLLRGNANFNELNDMQKLSLFDYSTQNSHWDIAILFMEDNDRSSYLNRLTNSQTKVDFLCFCICVPNCRMVEFIVKQGIEFNISDKSGRKPMHHALENKYWSVVELLLRKGSSLLDLNEDQKLSLFKFSSENCHWDIVKLFMENGDSDSNFDALNDQQRLRYLYYLISIGQLNKMKICIQRLIAKKQLTDINTPNKCGKTILHIAAQNGESDIVKFLVEENLALLNSVTNRGSTPLFLAVQNYKCDVVKYLVRKGADTVIGNIQGKTCAMLAAEKGYVDIVTFLEGVPEAQKKLFEVVKVGKDDPSKLHEFIIRGANVDGLDDLGSSPLHWASQKGKLKTVQCLIQEGADLTIINNNGLTPARLAASGEIKRYLETARDEKLFDAAKRGDCDMICHLIAIGVDVNIKRKDDESTPLHLAAKGGHMLVVMFLIHEGARTDAKDKYRNTAESYARQKGHESIFLYLKQIDVLFGAVRSGDLNKIKQLDITFGARTYWGYTPMHIAVKKGYIDILDYFLEKGADVNVAADDGWTLLHLAVYSNHLEVVKYLMCKGAHFYVRAKPVLSCDKYSPLHVAVEKGYLNIVKCLLDYGAEIDYQSDYGWTALHVAVYYNHLDIVKHLIKKSANLEARTKKLSVFYSDIHTPLHIAADQGYSDIVKCLINAGADIGAKDKSGDKPSDVAKRNKHFYVASLL